jgi:chromosome partitioning protein
VHKHHNPDLRLHGIVINRLRSTADEHEFRIDELADVHGRRTIVNPPIPERIAVQQAEGMGTPVQTVGTAGAREVSHLLDTHLTKLLRS